MPFLEFFSEYMTTLLRSIPKRPMQLQRQPNKLQVLFVLTSMFSIKPQSELLQFSRTLNTCYADQRAPSSGVTHRSGATVCSEGRGDVQERSDRVLRGMRKRTGAETLSAQSIDIRACRHRAGPLAAGSRT